MLVGTNSDYDVINALSNNCKATAVAHTKRINRNLLRKGTTFVCVTHLQSCVKIEKNKYTVINSSDNLEIFPLCVLTDNDINTTIYSE